MKLIVIDSSDKIELGQTKLSATWRTELTGRLRIFLNFDTKTSQQSKAQISANIATLVIARCAGKSCGDKKNKLELEVK